MTLPWTLKIVSVSIDTNCEFCHECIDENVALELDINGGEYIIYMCKKCIRAVVNVIGQL